MKSAGARESGHAASARLRLGATSQPRRAIAALLLSPLVVSTPPVAARAQQQPGGVGPVPPAGEKEAGHARRL